jgi:hypothetical protein
MRVAHCRLRTSWATFGTTCSRSEHRSISHSNKSVVRMVHTACTTYEDSQTGARHWC